MAEPTSQGALAPLVRNALFGLAAVSLVVSLTATTGELASWSLIPQLLAAVLVSAGLIAHRPRQGAAASALVGLGAGLYLYQQKLDASGAPSRCNIGELFNCDLVNASDWSMAFGLPIALLGSAAYAALLLAAALAPAPTADDAGSTTLEQGYVVYGVLSVAYSAVLGWASTQIGALCVVCITMYLCNALILAAGLIGLRQLGRAPFTDLGSFAGRREAQAFLGGLAVLLLLGQNHWAANANTLPDLGERAGPPTPSTVELLARLYAKPAGTVATELLGVRKGPAEAPVTVYEYADFGCPHCARAGAELKELLTVRDDVAVEFRYFPLSGECNPGLEPGAPERCDGAAAAHCAGQQGRFWEMSELMFTNIGYLQRADLRTMAEQVGVEAEAFEACMDAPETREAIAAIASTGETAGVMGTPALFVSGLVDGEIVELTRGVPGLLKLVEARAAGIALPPAKAMAR